MQGHAVENVVTEVLFRGVRGLMAWGQWRGWLPPPPANSSLWAAAASGESAQRAAYAARQLPPLGGQMGNGMQPNLHNVYRDVRFTERHHLTNYACLEAGYVEQWGWKSVVAYPASALNVNITNSPHPLNVASVYRGTSTPGGFWIGNSTSDFIVEGSNISFGGAQCVVTGVADERFLAVNNDCAE